LGKPDDRLSCFGRCSAGGEPLGRQDGVGDGAAIGRHEPAGSRRHGDKQNVRGGQQPICAQSSAADPARRVADEQVNVIPAAFAHGHANQPGLIRLPLPLPLGGRVFLVGRLRFGPHRRCLRRLLAVAHAHDQPDLARLQLERRDAVDRRVVRVDLARPSPEVAVGEVHSQHQEDRADDEAMVTRAGRHGVSPADEEGR
jgi:hypothetical protein